MAGATAPGSSGDALSTSYYLVILLTHLGCFFLFSSSSSSSASPTADQASNSAKHPPQLTRKRRISPISCAFPQRDPADSVTNKGGKDRGSGSSSRSTALVPDFVLRCSIRSLFSFHKPAHQSKPPPALPANHPLPPPHSHDLPAPDLAPVRTSSVRAATTPNNATTSSDGSDTAATPKTGVVASASSSSHSSFSGRADVHACATCGDVFPRPHLLDLHHSARHAFADLPEADSGGGIVRIIFLSGWKPSAVGSASPAVVRRVLRVRNPVRAMQRFEECRDAVRARAAERKAGGDGKDVVGDLERCVADGNERLRFVGATYVCGGLEGRREGEGLRTCGSGMCRVCGIARNGFGGKAAVAEEEGGVRTYATGWAAHSALSLATEAEEEEFAFLQARKAVIVCRVVAGRVKVGGAAAGNKAKEEEARGMTGDGDGVRTDDEDGFDSAVVSSNAGGGAQDQLLVFNPRAVLPCFVILYSA